MQRLSLILLTLSRLQNLQQRMYFSTFLAQSTAGHYWLSEQHSNFVKQGNELPDSKETNNLQHTFLIASMCSHHQNFTCEIFGVLGKKKSIKPNSGQCTHDLKRLEILMTAKNILRQICSRALESPFSLSFIVIFSSMKKSN